MRSLGGLRILQEHDLTKDKHGRTLQGAFCEAFIYVRTYDFDFQSILSIFATYSTK